MAGFGPADVTRLLADAGIIRNRAKIEAVIRNAAAALAVPGGMAAMFWSTPSDPAAAPPAPVTTADVPAWTPASKALAQELKPPRVLVHRPGHGVRHLPGLRRG